MTQYNKQNWSDGPGGGTPLSAARLNAIENGIAAAAVLADVADSATPTGAALRAALGTVVNVKWYGAKGDGVANDTAALQAALNASTIDRPRAIFLPAGEYRITAGLDFPFAPGTVLFGEGKFATKITQATAGQPVIAFRNDLTHSIHMHDLTLGYNSVQTNAASIAVFYRVAGGSGGGFFHHVYENMDVQSAYRGFALADDGGSQTLWSVAWRDVNFHDIKDRAISMVPASVIGIPTVVLDHVGVYNTGSGTQPTGPAFQFSACEVTARAIDVEGWYEEVFWSTGGGWLDVRGLHVEHHKFAKAFTRMVYIANGPFNLDGFSIAAATTAANTDTLVLVYGETGARITLRNGSHNVDTTLATSYVREMSWADTGTDVSFTIENVSKVGGGINQPGAGPRAGQVAEFFTSTGQLPAGGRGLTGPALYLMSPDGTRYKVTVANGGTLTVTAAP